MEFEPRHKQHWSRATKPRSLKEIWSNLESFIYAIAKTFKPFDDSDELHLVELGFSKFEDFNSSYNGLSRLSGLKTGLISFKVHRLYLYDSSFDTNLKSSRALQAEQRLHTAIEEDYKPGRVRVKFRGVSSITDLNPNTGWFAIPKPEMPKFLKWLDDQVFYEINPVALYGTAFAVRTSTPIPIDKSKSYAAKMQLGVVSSRARADPTAKQDSPFRPPRQGRYSSERAQEKMKKRNMQNCAPRLSATRSSFGNFL